MLVFGDQARDVAPHELVAELRARLATRPFDHAALVTVFIIASELAQGLADAQREEIGCDERRPTSDAAMRLLVDVARALARSWDGGSAQIDARVLTSIEAIAHPSQIRTKRAEGYAFYGLYPEAYLLAARQAGRARHVIGIRSIGCGLAAIVAAATGAPLPVSLRPEGDPDHRSLHVGRALLAEWRSDPAATFAIVDEGPGRSGSSFGTVVDVLENHGVDVSQIACFPSHANQLGPVACERHRTRWRRIRKHVVTFDELLIDSGRLASWIAELVGPLDRSLEDISAGAWRRLHFRDEHAWPPVIAYQERRKLLAHTHNGTWLARFVGLGRDGEAAFARARELHAQGFTPEVAGLRHGFLVERWQDDARPLDLTAIDRGYLVDHVGRYLAARARRRAPSGAKLDELIAMVRRNVTLGLGAGRAGELVAALGNAGELARRRRPVEIDGRLHAWEWLVRGDNTLIKTDAYDHHASHDLIGCQDITWDVAGAVIELELTAAEQARLVVVVADASGSVPDPALLQLSRVCYLAFQLGRMVLGAESAEPAEAARLQTAAARYAALLAR